MRRTVLAARLVGRDEELNALRAALVGATEGRGGVAFLVGEPGIGKSRLGQAIAAEAVAGGSIVLRGRAVQATTPVAYRPLAEALCSAVRAAGVPDAPDLAPFRPVLGRLIPEWRVDHEGADDSPVALAEATLRFLRAVADDRGCVLVLEDLHWADPETLTVVEYLADNLAAERLLCVATLRDERGSALDFARGLAARRACDLLELSRLDDDEVAEMVRSCLSLDVPDEVVAFAARADGVPFLVEELLAVAVTSGALVAEGEAWTLSGAVEPVVPLTFADSVRRRLAALGDDARAVLLAAAVLGRGFDWELLPSITERPESAVLAALHAAVEAQIVAVDAEARFRFRHALSRDAVLRELLPPERASLSRRALAALEAAQPELAGDWCELAAELAERAGDRARAATLLLEVARRALRDGALASAESALERARVVATSEEATALEIEESLAHVLSLAGKSDAAIEVGEALLARLGSDPARAGRRAEAHLRIARAAVAATRWNDANAAVERARAEAVAASDEHLLARADALGAQASIVASPERAVALAQAALDSAERLELPEVACEALEILGRYQRPRDLDAAEVAFDRAYAIATENDLVVWRVRALHELGTVDLLRFGSPARLDEARELALSQGALATAAVIDVSIAAVWVMRDDPEPALAASARAAEIAQRYGLRQTLAAALAFEAHVHARAGRAAEMEHCIERARAEALDIDDMTVLTSHAAAVLALVEEDRPRATRHLLRAVPSAVVLPGDQSTGPPPGVLALVRAVDAQPPLPTIEPTHLMAAAYLRYAEAVAAGRAGESDRAMHLVAEGDRRLGPLNWYRHYGRRLVAEAAIADGWGEPVVWLREALAFFDERGEEHIASACRSLLRRAGAPLPRRRAGTDAIPPSLRALGVTARELEVMRLLAEGLPNREIGARLYLSPRTVERHVANLVVKAGVARRAELVAFAARVIGGAPAPN